MKYKDLVGERILRRGGVLGSIAITITSTSTKLMGGVVAVFAPDVLKDYG